MKFRIGTIAKTFSSIALAAVAMCSLASRAFAGIESDIKVMTFNLRFAKAHDGHNNWIYRKDSVGHFLANESPDIAFFQESMLVQTQFLKSVMPDYTSVWRGRKADPESDEACPIFFKHERFTAEKSGVFWLSSTPSVPGSRSWGNFLPRIATWVRLKDQVSNKTILVLNTQFDFEKKEFQIPAMHLILDFIKNNPADGIVFGGDLNSDETHPAVQLATKAYTDSWRKLHPEGHTGTFEQWKGTTLGPRIDFIFSNATFVPLQSKIYTDKFEDRLLSDHFPVATTFSIADETP